MCEDKHTSTHMLGERQKDIGARQSWNRMWQIGIGVRLIASSYPSKVDSLQKFSQLSKSLVISVIKISGINMRELLF